MGRVGLSRSNTDGINIHFVFRFVDLLIMPLSVQLFLQP